MAQFNSLNIVALLMTMIAGCAATSHQPDLPRTYFQMGYARWVPQRDYQADVAIVYDANETLVDRMRSWKEQGYETQFMTGVAWGNYGDYVSGKFDGVQHMDEAQRRRDGSPIMHDPSTPYFVPSKSYREYLKTKLKAAIDAGATAIYLEEPEFWAPAGYSEAFKREFKNFYGIDWSPPHESIDARWKCDRLKYILYRDTLDELFQFAKSYRPGVTCFVPTHSLISYAHSRMVSPMSSLMSLQNCDGYIAQIETGTARQPNIYRGVLRERTFESAFLEYAQMVAMVRPTGRTCILLADPVEDDPYHGWDDYEANYKRTLVASLFAAEESHYEVAPWPDRVFEAQYFASERDARRRDKPNPPPRVKISDAYASVLLTCFNALADMPTRDVRWDCASNRIGVVVSDTMMFQRDDPHPSDEHFGNFFGLAMPLVKHGIAAKIVQLETLRDAGDLRDIDVLLLTYEGMKPQAPRVHEILAKWVRRGGKLVLIDDFRDPYHQAAAWWNSGENHFANAAQDLIERLRDSGRGKFVHVAKSPTAMAKSPDGADEILALIGKVRPQSHLVLRRGSYVVAAAMDETSDDRPVTLRGRFVDLFDANLPVVENPTLKPGDVRLYRDVDAVKAPAVIAASARIRDDRASRHEFSFHSRGPSGTKCVCRVAVPAKPQAVDVSTAAKWEWDESSKTLVIRHDNIAADVRVAIRW